MFTPASPQKLGERNYPTATSLCVDAPDVVATTLIIVKKPRPQQRKLLSFSDSAAVGMAAVVSEFQIRPRLPYLNVTFVGP